jgi:hypothetical protein
MIFLAALQKLYWQKGRGESMNPLDIIFAAKARDWGIGSTSKTERAGIFSAGEKSEG